MVLLVDVTITSDTCQGRPTLPFVPDKSSINGLQGSKLSGALMEIVGILGVCGAFTKAIILEEESQLLQSSSILVHLAFKFICGFSVNVSLICIKFSDI